MISAVWLKICLLVGDNGRTMARHRYINARSMSLSNQLSISTNLAAGEADGSLNLIVGCNKGYEMSGTP